MLVSEIVRVTKGVLLSGDPSADIAPERMSTDSRTIGRGGFFIALKGANFNANRFLEEVFRKGAIGAVIMGQGPKDRIKGKIIIRVKDTTKALQDIARSHRMKFRIPVIAVTGSNGKTTAKEMIWRVLSSRYNVLKNEGTKNNHIGVPQTLLRLKAKHDICVLELGTNHKGEIKVLGDIARPTVCVMMNIGPSHLEFLSSLKGVYEEKKRILGTFFKASGGTAVLNGDDEYLAGIRGKGFRIFKFGFKESNDYRGCVISRDRNGIKFSLNGRGEFALRLLGTHNVYNALAAITVARQFRVSYESIRKALLAHRPAHMRLDPEKVNGVDIINDAYNSNPMSMKQALEVVQYYPAKKKWVVIGDMLELGKDSVGFHRMIGELAAKSGVEGLLTFGRLSKHALSAAFECGMDKGSLRHCSSPDEIAAVLKKVTRKGDVVLLKGSRAMRLEEVLDKLKTKNLKPKV